MKILRYTAVAGLLAFASLLTQPANAIGLGGLSRDSGSTLGKVAQPVRAPLAYLMFCLKSPRECDAGSDRIVSYGFDLAKTIRNVNYKVNKNIKPRLDKRDIWKVATKAGDCEDFALAKRKALISAGIPSGALRMAVVLTEKGDGHAVLVVRTDIGDLVLDNRRSSVKNSRLTGYTFLKMATENPLSWLELGDQANQRSTKGFHI